MVCSLYGSSNYRDDFNAMGSLLPAVRALECASSSPVGAMFLETHGQLADGLPTWSSRTTGTTSKV
jgi:hypothetical protein